MIRARAIIFTHPINQNPFSLPPGAAQNSDKITLLGLSTSSIPKDQLAWSGVWLGYSGGADERRGLQQVQNTCVNARTKQETRA